MSESATTESAPAGEPSTDDSALPEWAREKLTKANNEAAKYRTEKNDAVTKAQTDTRAEVIAEYEPQVSERDAQIATLTTDLTAATTDNLKLRAVLGSEGVAASDVLDLVELVQGSDEESITASVKRVLAVYGKKESASPAYDPTIGSGNGGTVPLNGSPVLDMLKAAVGAK